MKLQILVGTTTGNAQQAAQTLSLLCEDHFDQIEIRPMDNLRIGDLDPAVVTLICCATHGSGDVPEQARGLWQSLQTEPRYLGQLRYGLVALGDQACYPDTFARGGLQFDELLLDLGAQRIGPVCLLDASDETSADTRLAAWADDWLTRV